MNSTTLLALLASLLWAAVALFVSGHGKPLWVRIVAWVLFPCISLLAVFNYWQQQKVEVLHLSLIGPSIAAKRAFDRLKLSKPEALVGYDLIEVLGSYYICIQKPDRLFHQFPEWVFIFRKQNSGELVEYRVSDSRLPRIPKFSLGNTQNQNPGYVLNHFKYKVSPMALGAENASESEDRDSYVQLDTEGKGLVEYWGRGPSDTIEEVADGPNASVLARVRTVGRSTDDTSERIVSTSPSEVGGVVIRTGTIVQNIFHSSLHPIINWNIDVDDAIQRARQKGALAIAPGKSAMGGGPGLFRLFNGQHRNLSGPYWEMPYRIGIRPIRVDATSGSVFAVNDRGEYAMSW